MVDVTKENFRQLLPEILDDIKTSCLVSVDTEFTGLVADQSQKGSLFDDGSQRYQKLCCHVNKFTVCQFGLSLFKWFYDGIPYLSHEQEEKLRAELPALLKGETAMDLPYEIRDLVTNIIAWSMTVTEGNEMSVETKTLDDSGRILLVINVRLRCPDLWAEQKGDEIIISKVTEKDRLQLDRGEADHSQFIDTIVDQLSGVTLLFNEMICLKKPLVIHNGLLDLMFMYRMFNRRLPNDFGCFKSAVHDMFPLIYDTKFLALQLKKEFKDKEDKVKCLVSNSGLGDLAAAFQKEIPVLFRPSIHMASGANKYADCKPMLHEAGYDAYLTGSTFIIMSHMYTLMQMKSTEHHRPLSPRELVYALSGWANKIYLQRAAVPYVMMDGKDPPSDRPPWLLVSSKGNNGRVTPAYVSAVLGAFGSMDVFPRNHQSVLVAAASWDCTREILKNEHRLFHVTKYCFIRHSPVFRGFAWFGVIVSGGTSMWLLYNSVKNLV